jgi:hypothetical protein
LYSFFK